MKMARGEFTRPNLRESPRTTTVAITRIRVILTGAHSPLANRQIYPSRDVAFSLALTRLDAVKHSLTFGLLLALAGSLTSLGLFLAGYHDTTEKLQVAQKIQMAVGVAASVACLVAAIRAQRADAPAEADWGYGSAFGTGVLTGLCAVVIGSAFSYVYFKFIDPNLNETLIQMQLAAMAERGMPAKSISEVEPMVRRWMMPEIMTLMQAVTGLIASTVLSALIALFFRARPTAAATPV